jgi:signal transduction histidine kinase
MKISLPDNINLLIVDDSLDNIMALEAGLEADGLTIFTTTSPKTVEKLCIDNNISIALVDIKMPELDGFELLDMIKTNPKTEHIRVILITGYSMSSEDVLKGLNKGAVDYLFKPLDLHITIAKVKSLITLISNEHEIIKKNSELETYQKELFMAIKQTEKSKLLKENFLANMSHEIRTPLNGIIGLTSLLKGVAITEDQLEIIRLMEFSTKSLLGIVNDILESAQIDAGKITIKRSKINLIELVNNVSDLTLSMANEKGLKLVCKIDADVPQIIIADPLRLNQILINLINNAIKFTDSGTINIDVSLINKKDGRALIQFIIKDSGKGIPESELKTIFNRFEQIENKSWEKFGGTGLGLSIVKKLVELKGGTLKVESTVGVGSSFIFTNEYDVIEDEVKGNTINDHLTTLPKFNNILILLAEDNFTNQFIALKMLKEWNIRVDVAINGLDAFEKIKEKDYDLVLMDTHMPVMDGNEATKKIRKELTGVKRSIPIISYSASVMEREREEAKLAGVDDFMEKPFEPEILNSKIHKLIRERKLNSEASVF